MQEIDVDAMEEQEYRKDVISNILKKKQERAQFKADTPKPLSASKSRAKKPIKMFSVPKTKKSIVPKITAEKKKIEKEENDEIFTSMKSSIFEGLALPMKDKRKRPVLKEKLMESKFMGRFIKTNLYDDYFKDIDDRVKFGFVYAYHYTNTLLDIKLDDNK
jgi:hypothetical protein